MSPANAVKDHLKDWCYGPAHDDYVSMAVIADGTYYGIPKGMCFSLPVITKDFDFEVVKKFHILDHEGPIKLIKDSIDEIYKEYESIGFKL